MGVLLIAKRHSAVATLKWKERGPHSIHGARYALFTA
jgi:hypothetical protein